jgi:asparagine synthase (glutamine-hydrolysing)
MCGIAGSIRSNNQVDERLLRCIRHRGPDDQAYYKDEEVVLYHARLAIQDIEEGKQPMFLDDNLVTVYNGEIYNHMELRKKYELHCTTRSDTETILHLYRKLGIAFVDELDGMFAIALYDKQKQKLWLIRDRAGKKPIYYYSHLGEWLFASELNAIRSVTDVSIQQEYFYEYLRIGAFYRTHTPYQHVFELPAGHLLEIDTAHKTAEVNCWWNIKKFYQQPATTGLSEALQRADDILHQAVQQRMISSDLEVGCFLSGGIDSGLVATIAAGYNSQLKTFTVAFPGAYNEAPLAKLVADKIGSHHTEINIDFADLKDNIESILANYGEPFTDSSAIPTWYVSREAKKHVTVILNGDGADELFGGYRRYVPFAQYDFFRASSLVKGTAATINKILPVSNEKKSVYNYLYRLTRLAKNSPLEVYTAAGVDIFEGYVQTAFKQYDPSIFGHIEQDIDTRLAGVNGGLNKLMLLDFDINLMCALLVKMDIGSMAHALEGRSPFLCKSFLEWAPTLPADLKIKGKTTKYLLRQLSTKYLPSELINQPKRGFEIPLKNWVNGDLNNIIHDYLMSSRALYNNFIEKSFVQSVLNKKLNVGEEKRAKILWTLFAIEVWYRKCYLT